MSALDILKEDALFTARTTGELTGPLDREEAFGEHIERWLTINNKIIYDPTMLTRERLVQCAAMSAWNAALSWAAHRLGERE